jgi:iron complex transport system substrate-binding protein
MKPLVFALKMLLAISIFVATPIDATAFENRFIIKNNHEIIDQYGRTIIVETPFKRIISLYGAHTENLFALGLDMEIIGVSRNDTYPEKALKKRVFSYHDDPEKFISVNPDLILIRPMIERGYKKLLSILEQYGVTVVSIQPTHIEELFLYWRILGLLTGRTKRSDDMIHCFTRTVATMKKMTEGVSVKKRAYFEAIHSKMKTFAPNAMAIFALKIAGGKNIACDASSVRGTNIAFYGKERIISMGEQIDAYLAQYGSMNRPTKEIILNEPGFQVIKAVQNKEVYIFDEMLVSRPTLRLLKGAYEIGSCLYPEIFTHKKKDVLESCLMLAGGSH